MKRRVGAILCWISVVLWVASAGLFVWSCWRFETIQKMQWRAETEMHEQWEFGTGAGRLWFARMRRQLPKSQFQAFFSKREQREWLAGEWELTRAPVQWEHLRQCWRPELRSERTGPDNMDISVMVPYWILLVVTGLWPAVRVVGFWRRRSRLRAGLCVKCGYDLRASEGRCPECGEKLERAATRVAD